MEFEGGKDMRHKKILAVCVVIVIVVAVVMLLNSNDKNVKIDEWSSHLSTGQIDWAEVSKEYGVNQVSYTIPTSEYVELIAVLETVTEDVSSRKIPKDITDKNDYRLSFMYDQEMWLFQCYDNGMISLTYEDEEKAQYYGCAKNSLLYIDSSELWEYIMDTVDSKAVK